MENRVLKTLLSGIYGFHIRHLIARDDHIEFEVAPSPDENIAFNHFWSMPSSLLQLINMVQPAAQKPSIRNFDEAYDIIPDLEDMFDTAHITVVNANTKRNPSAKNDPDLVDYVIVTGNLSIPKKKNSTENGYEEIKLRRVEASARKRFERGNATETLALYRKGYLGIVSEERVSLLEKDAAVEEKFAREEREDSEFVMVGLEDYIL